MLCDRCKREIMVTSTFKEDGEYHAFFCLHCGKDDHKKLLSREDKQRIIANRMYYIRIENELGGDAESDWQYADRILSSFENIDEPTPEGLDREDIEEFEEVFHRKYAR